MARHLRRLGTRLGRESVGWWGLGGAAAALVVAFACRTAGLAFLPVLGLVGGVALVPVLVAVWRHARIANPVWVAREVERRHSGFDNLLVTAAELETGAQARSALADEVVRAALDRLARFDEGTMRDGRRVLPAFVAVMAVAAAVIHVPRDLARPQAGPPADVLMDGTVFGIDDVRVHVTPPEYIGQPASVVHSPDRLEVPHGSEVAIAVTSLAARVEVSDPDGPARPLSGGRATRVATLTADASTVWAIRALDKAGAVVDERWLPVSVREDQAPFVRVVSPGADQVFPDARRRVAVAVEATDDHGLARLALRYTRVTGSGETFTFTEGEMPVRLERRSPREWRGEVEIDLEALGLETGDTLVYRAAARDRRPGADDALSDSFLIEIGGLRAAASGGFTLPEDEHRHAISQQMVIIKTESLHAARGRMPADEFLEESHHLAVEQRMVRAEFVFMTGGHVHDEVEEAEASHELAEGRFENEAMVEMLAAASHMSRAERHLTDGDTADALVAERLALTALQRAFDRRRYFLRTTPDRSRIDLDRRLSGSLEDARSWVRAPAPPDDDAGGLEKLQEVLHVVARASRTPGMPLSDVARAVAALDPGSPDVQQVVTMLGSAGEAARAEALAEVAVLLRARAARSLAPAAEAPREPDPARGRLRRALEPGGAR